MNRTFFLNGAWDTPRRICGGPERDKDDNDLRNRSRVGKSLLAAVDFCQKELTRMSNRKSLSMLEKNRYPPLEVNCLLFYV